MMRLFILLIFPLFCAVSVWATDLVRRSYKYPAADVKHLTDTISQDSCDWVASEICFAASGVKGGEAQIMVNDSLKISIHFPAEDEYAIPSMATLEVQHGSSGKLRSHTARGTRIGRCEYTVGIERDVPTGVLSVYHGYDKMTQFERKYVGSGCDGLCLDIRWSGDACATAVVSERFIQPLVPSVSHCGYKGIRYRYLDSDLATGVMRHGGHYELDLISYTAEQCSEALVYVAGSEVDSGQWHPGMLKAVLSPTPFEGHYDVKWFDSECRQVDDEVSAQFVDEARTILVISFPKHKSQVRFVRVTD